MLVCDVCEQPDRSVVQYEVRVAGVRRAWDLCDEHSADLRKLCDGLPPPAPRRIVSTDRRPSRRPAEQVVTMEEIEAMKKNPKNTDE